MVTQQMFSTATDVLGQHSITGKEERVVSLVNLKYPWGVNVQLAAYNEGHYYTSVKGGLYLSLLLGSLQLFSRCITPISSKVRIT